MILPRRRKREVFLPWIQLAVDGVVIWGVLKICFWLRFTSGWFESALGQSNYFIYSRSFWVVTLITLFFLRAYELYKPARSLSFAQETTAIFKAVTASFLVLMAATFFIRDFTFSRTFLVLAGLATALGVSAARLGLGNFIIWSDQKRGSLRNILVIGSDENAQKLISFCEKNPRLGQRVSDTLTENKIEDLAQILKTNRHVHEVVVSTPHITGDALLKIIATCEKEMVTFRWVADVFGLIASRMSFEYLGGIPLLSFSDSPLCEWENRAVKRGMDILLSGSALILLSPVLAVIAALVKLDSQGPVFYQQERVGEDGRHFNLFKFRTMQSGAEAQTGPVWAKENDPRRTKLGSFLRQNNLDELPQLWNVLRGDMSLVGPRPERPFFVSQFKEDIPRYMARHTVRSGITGWAQVNGLRGNTSIEERTKFDLYYIENWSLFFDIKILFMTLFAKKNAY
jgi:exopolysaccharide biosynthesis polyprenyl glycosylphosphotransferase